MGYKSIVNRPTGNRAIALTEIWKFLRNTGWTLHDSASKTVEALPASIDTGTDLVNATSHGFVNGNRIFYTATQTADVIGGLSHGTNYFIVGVALNTFQLSLTQGGAAINFTSQGTGTHTIGEGQRVYKSNGENADRIYEYICIYWSPANAITLQPWYTWNATTHAGSGGNTAVAAITTSGTSVVINVANATDFIINNYYQIVGINNEGRDRVQVTAKTSNTLTIASLPRNYASGSFIGQCPSTFGMLGSGYILYMTCSASVAGLTDTSTSGGIATSLITDGAVDPDSRCESRYILTPIIWAEGGVAAFAYNDKYFYAIPTTGLSAEDTVGVGEIDTGTSTSDPNTSTTLKDNTKAWGTDVQAGKVVIITFGVIREELEVLESGGCIW